MNTRSKNDDYAWLLALCEQDQPTRERQVVDKLFVTRTSPLHLNHVPLGLPLDAAVETVVLLDGLCAKPATKWQLYIIDPALVEVAQKELLGRHRRRNGFLMDVRASKVTACNRMEPSRVPTMVAFVDSYRMLQPTPGDWR